MKISFATILMSGLALSNAAAITKRDKETQEEYDEESASFISQGLCRVYETTDTSVILKGLSTCSQECGNLVASQEAAGNTASVSCVSGGQGIPTITDPDGNNFVMGECECNIPILDEVVDDVLLSLPAIAEIGCEIMFDSMDLVLKIGALAIPGAGEEIDAGTAAGLKAAKAILKAGKKASTFAQWLENPCGVSNYTAKIDDIFNPLSQASDDVVDAIQTHSG